MRMSIPGASLDIPTPQPISLSASARLRLYETILQATPDLVYVFDLQHRFIYANEALLAMWGCSLDEAMGKTCLELGYEPWHAAMHDEEIERVIATRQPIRGDVPFIHHVLGRRIYDYIFTPVIGPDGAVDAIAGTTRDVTDRTLQEEALQQSERRFSAMVNASSDLLYRMSHDWRESEIIGGRQVGSLPSGAAADWMDYIHPEDRLRVATAVQRARDTVMPFETEHRISRDEGQWSWVSSRAVPIQDDGKVVEWFGAATDITGRVRNEEHLRLLVNELNHRVKNTLAIVQSIATQTLRNNADPALAAEQIESRLLALSQAHDVLTRKNWEGARVEDIVRTAIAPLAGGDASAQFEVTGPDIWLDPRRALALSMALHELCTNAMKYGALSVREGRVRIEWAQHVSGDQATFQLTWRERGGPAVTAPGRRGFGSRLVERGLRHDLGGDVQLEFAPAGVSCHIKAPLPLPSA
jgi:PAS domain S-box-containing protein